MPTFTLTPYLRIVNRYLTYTTDEEFDEVNPGYRIEELKITLDWAVFNDEAVFARDFKLLLNNYGLLHHYDNLLYLVLSRFDDIWSQIQHHYDDYEAKKRAKELATLLILLKETPESKLDIVTFKTYKGTAKIQDKAVNQWISDTLIKAIERKDYPMGRFGLAVMQMLTGENGILKAEALNLIRLKAITNKRLVNPKNRRNKGLFDLCLAVYTYLQGETLFKANDDVILSDTQLNFLFDLLAQLKQVDRLLIESEPKDYMRTFMVNHINAK